MSTGDARALEQGIEAAPDEPGSYHVYGDWLVERGDPRGELIAVEKALALDPFGDATDGLRARRRALLNEHRDAWVGPLEAFVRQNQLRLEWAHGFIRRAEVRFHQQGLEILAALLTHPSARFLSQLKVQGGGQRSFAPMVEALIANPRASLRALELDTYGARLDSLRPLLDGYPRLRTLGLVASCEPEVLSSLWHEGLEALRLDLRCEDLTALPLSRFSRLERLRLRLTFGVMLDQGRPRRFVDWLNTAPTALRELAFSRCGFADRLIDELPRLKHLPTLEALELIEGSLTSDGAERLIRHLPALPSLTRLDVSENRLSRRASRTLEHAMSGVMTEPQYPPQGLVSLPNERTTKLAQLFAQARRSAHLSGQVEEARRLFELVLTVSDRAGAHHERDRTLVAFGNMLLEQQRYAEAISQLSQSIELQRAHGAPSPDQLLSLARSHHGLGRLALPIELIEEALTVADGAFAGDLSAELAWLHLECDEPARALESAAGDTFRAAWLRALALARLGSLNEAEAQLAATTRQPIWRDAMVRSQALFRLGKTPAATKAADEALRLAWAPLKPRLWRGVLRLELGHIASALEDLEAALALARACHDTLSERHARAALAQALFEAGRRDEAIREAEEALRLSASGLARAPQCRAMGVLARVERRSWDEALALARTVDDVDLLGQQLVHAAQVRLFDGASEEASALIEEARGLGLGPLRQAWVDCAQGMLFLGAGQLEQARALFDRARASAEALGAPSLEAEGLMFLAVAGADESARAQEVSQRAGAHANVELHRLVASWRHEQDGGPRAEAPRHLRPFLAWLRAL